MIAPHPRGDLERYRPEIRDLAEDPELAAGHFAWGNSRQSFNHGLRQPGSPSQKQGWQRHYMRGATVTERRAPEHQTGLKLAEFTKRKT